MVGLKISYAWYLFCTCILGLLGFSLLEASGELSKWLAFEHYHLIISFWTKSQRFATLHLVPDSTGHEHNFVTYPEDVATGFGEPYDYGSVLHYSRRAFSANGEDTIVPVVSIFTYSYITSVCICLTRGIHIFLRAEEYVNETTEGRIRKYTTMSKEAIHRKVRRCFIHKLSLRLGKLLHKQATFGLSTWSVATKAPVFETN